MQQSHIISGGARAGGGLVVSARAEYVRMRVLVSAPPSRLRAAVIKELTSDGAQWTVPSKHVLLHR